jgi:hypothetical protein
MAPYITTIEADRLAVREQSLLRHILGGSNIHPNTALYLDWDILSVPQQQQQIAYQITRTRMEAYDDEAQIHKYILKDLALPSRASGEGYRIRGKTLSIRSQSRICYVRTMKRIGWNKSAQVGER